ncbi:MAG: hypothetical protein IKT52_14785 [Oscillospiraceae bacterium]|nr:hypothetical protein [Oscillospiraceae bacterium]
MDDLIYNQTKIPKNQWRYGLRTSAATGCGWIATYNALRLMGYSAKPEDLIRYYERQLPLIHGNGGTIIQGPALFFQKHGFRVETLSVEERFDEAAKQADVCILFYYWRKKFRIGAHFVTVQHKDGRFTGYNTFRTSDGPDDYGTSLKQYLKKQGFFMPFLIAVKDKRSV